MTRLGLWLRGPWPTTERDRPRDGPAALARALDLVGLAERSGFDSVWVSDQEPSTASGPPGPVMEAYALLGALATGTTETRLGVVPLGPDRRAPSMVAKMVTGIDVISHGRAILTYGLGTDPERRARMVEALHVGRALLEDEAPTFAGACYSVVDARNQPGPVQEGGIPIVASVERVADLTTVTEFAGLADAVIVPGPPDELGRVVDLIGAHRSRGAAGQTGRAPLQVIGIGPHRAATATATSRSHRDRGGAVSVDQVVAAVGELFDSGLDGCLVPVDVAMSPDDLAAMVAGLGGAGITP